jgi:hypothetical protein
LHSDIPKNQTRGSQWTNSDVTRTRNQADRILEMLREAGPEGCTNVQLFTVCHALNARINDLRQEGYGIEAKRERGGVWRYTLTTDKPSTPRPSPTHAEPSSTLPLFPIGGGIAKTSH